MVISLFIGFLLGVSWNKMVVYSLFTPNKMVVSLFLWFRETRWWLIPYLRPNKMVIPFQTCETRWWFIPYLRPNKMEMVVSLFIGFLISRFLIPLPVSWNKMVVYWFIPYLHPKVVSLFIVSFFFPYSSPSFIKQDGKMVVSLFMPKQDGDGGFLIYWFP